MSDRISFSKYPEQYERDINIISIIVKEFKKYLGQKSRILAEDKIRVIFYPSPNDKISNMISNQLNIDLADYDAEQKLNIFKSVDSIYVYNLKELYTNTINSKSFHGADLFSFFSYKVEDYCIINDTNYINILFIISDGYLYWQYNKISQANRYSYIGPNAEHINIFRNNPNWQNVFIKEDYGFIRLNKNLNNLNIIALEFAPDATIPRDFEILQAYWSKWFDEMNVKSYKIVQTDLPGNTKLAVEKYWREVVSIK